MKTFFIVKWAPPADLLSQDKAAYWALAATVVLDRKDRELAAGIAADGKPLGRPSARWLRRRKSKMLPDAVPGDPSAPLFQPGREISRVRSLLTARGYAEKGHVRVWWRFDPQVGAEFGEILADWAKKKGRRWNVIGMSPKSVEWCRKETNKRWKKARPSSPPANGLPDESSILPIVKTGKQTTQFIDLSSDTSMREVQAAIDDGRFSGWRTSRELDRLMRSSGDISNTIVRNPSRTAPVVNRGVSNIVLQHTWRVSTNPLPANDPGLLAKLKRAWNKLWTAFGV